MVVGGPANGQAIPLPPALCYYTQVDHDITAAINTCTSSTVAGFVVKRNTTLELRPLVGKAAEAVHHALNKRGGGLHRQQGVLHLVKRVTSTNSRPPPPSSLDIPPPPCKEPIGNATPDDMEFWQGEIFTIPPQAWRTTPSTETGSTVAPAASTNWPPPNPLDKLMDGEPEEVFSKPPNILKRRGATGPVNTHHAHYQHKVIKRSITKTIELGVFFDQAAYDLFFPYLGSREALTEFILAYINGIQALFHHPTLGQKVKLVINYIEVMAQQPETLLHFGGDREKLYDSFRLYNDRKIQSVVNMVDVLPWDMGILISGHNFYSVKTKTGEPTYSTMGLAAVRGVCHPEYSAVIVELGATDTWGKPYPSAGFVSVYVMAHEIGHNLGMLHDGYGNSCPKNGYIMSASRSTSGETNWSSCSREVLENITAPCLSNLPEGPIKHDHSKYEQLPGQTWDAYDQCRVFLKDEEATLYSETLDKSVCTSVMCRSPNRIGYFKAGPALDGTFCGNNSWCTAGVCTPWPVEREPPIVKGGWSAWHHIPCQSGCLINAHGIQVSKRNCSNPKPKNSAERCQGVSAILNPCDDTQLCSSNRMSIMQYADNKCLEFSTVVTDLKPTGAQAPHNPDRQWQACAIFCLRASGTWYSPRTDLSYLPHFDTYFPDGTPCHMEAGKQYYCQRHQCLPKGHREAKALLNPDPEWDVHVYQNAPPKPSNNTVPEQVARIFELDKNMDPLQSEPLDLYHVENEALWEDNDYVQV
ncbi:A disintegrin and metalloproteinase with thrombospondin motifs adt-1-like isoform X2 [Panulirus ornatus]